MLFDAASSYNFVKRYLQVIRQDAAQTKTFRWRRSARRSSSPQMNGLVFFFRFNVNVSFKSLKYGSSGKVERLIVPALQPLSPVRMASLPSANLSMEANTSNNTSKAVTAMPGNLLLSFLHQTLLLLALRPTPSETKNIKIRNHFNVWIFARLQYLITSLREDSLQPEVSFSKLLLFLQF